MGRLLGLGGGFALALAAAVGCKHTVQYDTSVPVTEEWVAPPNEPRFDNPPEKGYTKAKGKKEFNQQMGAGGPGMGGMSNPGMGMMR